MIWEVLGWGLYDMGGARVGATIVIFVCVCVCVCV
jgi:hypothetical protein